MLNLAKLCQIIAMVAVRIMMFKLHVAKDRLVEFGTQQMDGFFLFEPGIILKGPAPVAIIQAFLSLSHPVRSMCNTEHISIGGE